MTSISATTSSSPEYSNAGASEPVTTTAVVNLDPMIELAALLIQTDFLRSELDAESLRAAREAERRANAAEIDAMRRAADAIEVQAWVSGGLAAVGGAAQCAGSVSQVGSETVTKWEKGLETGGGAALAVAEPAGQLTGGVAKARADTDAAQARHAAEAASSRASEAERHRERVLDRADSVLELAEAVLETEQQGNFAILGNF
jgi:hypothetical protein